MQFNKRGGYCRTIQPGRIDDEDEKRTKRTCEESTKGQVVGVERTRCKETKGKVLNEWKQSKGIQERKTIKRQYNEDNR